MSADPKAITGTFILNAQLEAKSTEDANEIIRLLLANKKHLKENNPGVLTYRINQFEQHVMVFEEYADLNAIGLNMAGGPYKAFEARITGAEGLLAKPLTVYFYKEQK